MGYQSKLILLIFSILTCCVHRERADNSEYFKQLTIEDEQLLSVFKNADHCKKLEIIEYFKADMLPAGEGYSQQMIEEIEKITKTEARRYYSEFGAGYNNREDFDNDIRDWKNILKCN